MYDDDFLNETLHQAFRHPDNYNIPKGIIRFDYGKDHGWWVRVTRDKVMFRELFSDNVHGSIEEALRKAILRRHEIISTIPVTLEITTKRGLPLDPEKRVKRYENKGKLRPYIFWQARWYDKDHVITKKNFAVFTHGEEKAKNLAIEAARINHNTKPKITKIPDLYIKQEFTPVSRAEIAISSVTDTIVKDQHSEEKTNAILQTDPYAFEGEKKFELHQKIERDRNLRNHKLSLFLEEHGKIFCELCLFNFQANYPFLSKDIIEVHHIIPLATLTEGTKVSVNDLMLLCSNCHFAVHQGDAEENLLNAMDHFESLQGQETT